MLMDILSALLEGSYRVLEGAYTALWFVAMVSTALSQRIGKVFGFLFPTYLVIFWTLSWFGAIRPEVIPNDGLPILLFFALAIAGATDKFEGIE